LVQRRPEPAYDEGVLLGHIERNTRVASVRAAMEELVKLFRKPKSKFCWFDFTVRGRRYRGSTQETGVVRASKVASLKLAQILEGTDPLPNKPTTLEEISKRFFAWIADARLETKTKTYYRNGWRMLMMTSVARMRADEISSDFADSLKFTGSSGNANCALRTLRRMLHKGSGK
jgi:hypothetical protein